MCYFLVSAKSQFDTILVEALDLLENDQFESAYEKLEWASVYNLNHPVPYLLKATILAKLHWEQRKKYEELSGGLFGNYLKLLFEEERKDVGNNHDYNNHDYNNHNHNHKNHKNYNPKQSND